MLFFFLFFLPCVNNCIHAIIGQVWNFLSFIFSPYLIDNDDRSPCLSKRVHSLKKITRQKHFSIFHSRFFAEMNRHPADPSRGCVLAPLPSWTVLDMLPASLATLIPMRKCPRLWNYALHRRTLTCELLGRKSSNKPITNLEAILEVWMLKSALWKEQQENYI